MEDEIICGIYKITSPTGRVYIGESKNIYSRFIYYYKLRCKTQTKLYRSLKKHGWENHTFEIIEECDFDDLLCRERYWQDFYDSSSKGNLNCMLTECGDIKKVFSKESRDKLSVSLRGRAVTEETKKKQSENHTSKKEGYIHPLKGLDSWNKGVSMTEEAKIKMIKTRIKNGSFKGCKNPNAKKVIDTSTGEVFCTIKEASDYLNIHFMTLGNYLNNRTVNKTPLMFLKEYIKLYPDFKI